SLLQPAISAGSRSTALLHPGSTSRALDQRVCYAIAENAPATRPGRAPIERPAPDAFSGSAPPRLPPWQRSAATVSPPRRIADETERFAPGPRFARWADARRE